MLEKAIKDFSIDVTKSYMIGNKPWVVGAGVNIGIE